MTTREAGEQNETDGIFDHCDHFDTKHPGYRVIQELRDLLHTSSKAALEL